MTTSTTLTRRTTTTTYTIVETFYGYYVTTRTGRKNDVLRDKNGWTRFFSTRNSARKRISRERFGDFHN